MKTLAIAFVIAGSTLVTGAAVTAQAADGPAQLRGSDTLFGAITDAVNQSGLQSEIQYLGGGSGLGEAGLRAGTQGIAPMSRALSSAAIEDLENQGVIPVQNVIGLDGVAVFVKRTDATVAQIDIPTLRAIYTCTITDWSQVPGSGQVGPIAVYRRNDDSGTTDTFKSLVGVTAFGPCATPLATTADIAATTSADALAIGYAGLSAERPENQALAIARTADAAAVAPGVTTIRDFSYPLARRLYVNSVADGRFPSASEQALLDLVLDRSFMDPILLANEFVTCLPVEEGGCP
jgi:phosphate transport system substrate-binding protein